MNVRFEELNESQRAGGIEAATRGLAASLSSHGVSVIRSSEEDALEPEVLPQVVHFHGIWSPALAKRWRYWRGRGIPCVMSLHGMAEPWALAHKALKKKVAWHLYQRPILNRASALHATSAREAENLRRLGLTASVALIPWGIEGVEELSVVGCQLSVETGGDLLAGAEQVEAWTDHGPRTTDNRQRMRTVLFVGRIYPVKGLPLLVEAWAKVRPAGWKLKIVGPDEAGHRAEIEIMVADANLGAEIEFTGALSGDALHNVYQEADVFILPSHTENFGMVVGEAMSHGLPVITTHGAPWELLESERCGWWVPISVEGIASALDDATRLSSEELTAMGARGRAVVVERFAWDRIAGDFVECYRWLLGEGDKPGCVV
jgi:glycosyltransferase involved in cell wall biosynthesis